MIDPGSREEFEQGRSMIAAEAEEWVCWRDPESFSFYYGPEGRASESRKLKSVTGIIRDLGITQSWTGKVDQAVLDRAALRGKQSEAAMYEYAVNGTVDLDPDSLVDGVIERVQAFERWWQATEPRYIGHSIVMHDPDEGYAGEADLVVEIDGRVTLLDIKCTSRLESSAGLQVGLLCELYWVFKPPCYGGALWVNPNANKQGYRFITYDHESLYQAAEWALREWRADTMDAWQHARDKRLEAMANM